MTEDEKKTYLWTGLIFAGLVAVVGIALAFGALSPAA